MYGSVFDSETNERRKLYNEELQRLFQRPNIVREIAKRWAGRARRKQGTLVRRAIEENPTGIRPLGRPVLRR